MILGFQRFTAKDVHFTVKIDVIVYLKIEKMSIPCW